MPRLIEAKTGQKATSFALRTGSAPSSYFLLKRALAKGQPSAVVVDFAMGILPDGPALPRAGRTPGRNCLSLRRRA